MNKEKKIVPLKLDVIFKRVFGNNNNKDIIIAFISAMLNIPQESIKFVVIENVELTPENIYQKFSRLDLKLTVDDRIVNIEMQVNAESDFRERTLFYWSKLYSEDLKSGEDYGQLKQTICINIINFNLFDYESYHSHFKEMETNRHEVLSEKHAIHFFELKKLDSARNGNPAEDWLDLINAETEGDLMAIQNKTTIPEVQKAIVILRELSGDEKVRQEAYYREKRLHDEASALHGARNEGKIEGKEEGRAEERAEMINLMRSNGATEEQLRKLLGDRYIE